MAEINLQVIFRRQFFAKATACCHHPEVIEFGGVQAMRQRLNVLSELQYAPVNFSNLILDIDRGLGKVLLQSIQPDTHDSNLLVHVIVQLSCDPRALLLVGLDQSASNSSQCFFGEFCISDIDRRPQHPLRLTVIEIQKYPVCPQAAHRIVFSEYSEFCRVAFVRLPGLRDGLPYSFPVLRMYAATIVLDICGICFRRYTKHGWQITKPVNHSAFDIPLPSNRPSG